MPDKVRGMGRLPRVSGCLLEGAWCSVSDLVEIADVIRLGAGGVDAVPYRSLGSGNSRC
jgi:hypothetical protein